MSSGVGRPVKVAHVVCTGAFAGVERYVADVAVEQAARGHAVTVIGGAPDRMAQALADTEVVWRAGANPLTAARALARSATGRWGHRPEVVHAHLTAAEGVAVALAPLHRAPVVATLHLARRRGGDGPKAAAYRAIGRRLSAQVAISERVAEASGELAMVAPSGVPSVDQPVPADRREPVVLALQRLEAEKGTDVLVPAWAASDLADRGWRFEVVGRGARLAEVEADIARLGVAASVRVIDQVPDARARLGEVAVVLAPTPDEGLGLVVLEAMAAATPVVAAAGGGHLETVGAVDGRWLFPPGDAAGAGRALADLAADPDELAAYGRRLRDEQRRRFTVAAHVDALDAVYATLR